MASQAVSPEFLKVSGRRGSCVRRLFAGFCVVGQEPHHAGTLKNLGETA